MSNPIETTAEQISAAQSQAHPQSLRGMLRTQETVAPYSRSGSHNSLRQLPLLELIQRTNEYLASSAPEFKLVRQDRCLELEFWLLTTGNDVRYEYLDARVSDPSRRKYVIPHRLFVVPPDAGSET